MLVLQPVSLNFVANRSEGHKSALTPFLIKYSELALIRALIIRYPDNSNNFCGPLKKLW